MSHQFVVDALEGHAVQILRVTHLDAAEVEAHHARVIADEFQHIAAAQFGTIASIGACPRQSVHGVVLMAIHVAALLQLSHARCQLLTLCLHVCLCCVAGGQQESGDAYY